MVWLIIGLVLLAAFGPILWLRPSKRDRLLAKLREAARRRGLIVEITQVPKIDPAPEDRVSAGGVVRRPLESCSAYRLPARERYENAPSWFLIKDKRSVEPSEQPSGKPSGEQIHGWIKHPEVPIRRMPPDVAAYWVDVGNAVRALEDRCIALEVNATAASWYWLENVAKQDVDEVVADIAERLNTIALLQKRSDEATRDAQSAEE